MGAHSVITPLDSHVEVSSMGGRNSTELNSTGMTEAVANLWCASIGEDCGGSPGGFNWRKRCCGDGKCQKLYGSPDGAMKCIEEQPVEPEQGCWVSNGAICQYETGVSTGCFATAAACSSATGKPPGCYEYNGAICEWVIGDDPSNCFETQGHCEARAAHSVITPLDSHVEVSSMGGRNSTELNSTGMTEAVANLWCASIGEDCGGSPGGFNWRKRCCGNGKCQKLYGSPDGAMKCIEEQPAQPQQQCVAFNGECGGPGRQTRPCCIDGFSCKKENIFSSVMKCMA